VPDQELGLGGAGGGGAGGACDDSELLALPGARRRGGGQGGGGPGLGSGGGGGGGALAGVGGPGSAPVLSLLSMHRKRIAPIQSALAASEARTDSELRALRQELAGAHG
jgi:hypothetical protein